MCNTLKCEPTQWTHVNDMTRIEASIYQSFLAGDMVALLDSVDAGLNGNVADVACFYLNWAHIDAPVLAS